jgi:hypothetical protein
VILLLGSMFVSGFVLGMVWAWHQDEKDQEERGS